MVAIDPQLVVGLRQESPLAVLAADSLNRLFCRSNKERLGRESYLNGKSLLSP